MKGFGTRVATKWGFNYQALGLNPKYAPITNLPYNQYFKIYIILVDISFQQKFT